MSIPRLVDSHTHVQFAAFKKDEDEVIKRALGAGIWMINVGTQKDTSVKAVDIANKYPEGLFATVGLHPIHTEKSYHDEQELGVMHDELGGFTSRGEGFDYDFYKDLARDLKVVAIGECGLDYYRIMNSGSGIKKQKDAFVKQIELAKDLEKPLMVHCRNAFGDLIEILNSYFSVHNVRRPGVMHFFSGTIEDAKTLLDMGFSFTFGGVITFARDYDEIIKYIPLDRILLETDAPYVSPTPHRGKRNEPMYVDEVAKKMAELKAVSYEKIAENTAENAVRVFGLKIARIGRAM